MSDKNFGLIHPKGNLILDIVRYKTEEGAPYYSVIATFSLDEGYKELVTVTTEIAEPSALGAMRVGIECFGRMYSNICSVVTIYDGDTGQRPERIDVNKMIDGYNKASQEISSQSNWGEVLQKAQPITKSLH